LPVGVLADASITEECLATCPGDVLVLYSDGISEAFGANGELFGLERLVDLVSTHAHLSAEDLCRTIVEAVEGFRGDAPRSDDVTLVVLKALPRRIAFEYPAVAESLQEITALVRRSTAAYGDAFAYRLELATSEIATNVIKYAYPGSTGPLRGTLTLNLDHVQLDLFDNGVAFDPASVPPPRLGEPHEGGYGLFIAHQMVDKLDHTAMEPRGNHWRLVKHRKESDS
jgi:anti-sigma regulatory factor (Ser/Thr protein kinase)